MNYFVAWLTGQALILNKSYLLNHSLMSQAHSPIITIIPPLIRLGHDYIVFSHVGMVEWT